MEKDLDIEKLYGEQQRDFPYWTEIELKCNQAENKRTKWATY